MSAAGQIDLSAGLVPKPNAAPSIDLSAGLVPKAPTPAPAAAPASSFASEAGGVLEDVGKGIAKGALSTTTGVSSLLHEIPGIGETLAPESGIKAAEQIATPTDTAQKVGKYGEQTAEFFLPAGAEEKGAELLGKLAEYLPEGVKFSKGATKLAARMIAEGISTGAVSKAQAGATEGTGLKPFLEGAAAGAAGPAVSKVAGKAAETAGKAFGFGRPGEELLTKGIKPKASARNFATDLKTAAPDLVQFAKATPIKTVADLNEAIPQIQEKIWNEEVAAPIEKHAAEKIDTKPVEQAVKDAISPAMREFDAAAAEDADKFAEKMARPRTVGEANDTLKYLNARLDSYFAKYPAARSSDLLKNPETAALEAGRRALRVAMIDKLADLGEKGVADARARWGALEGVGKEVEKRVNVAERQNPNSLLKGITKAGGIGEALGAVLAGHPAIGIPGAATAVAGKLIDRANNPDVLINRGIKALTREAEGPGTVRRAIGAAGTVARAAGPAERGIAAREASAALGEESNQE
jgi:hypothetical protein